MATEKQSKVKSRRKFLNPLFHKQTKKEDDVHLTRDILKNARQTGQLNLSSKHLSTVPIKLFSMYEDDDNKQVEVDFSRPASEDDEVWWNFKPLTHLDLSSNVLTNIPEDIGMFQDLIVLNLQDNNLTSLPNAIGKLSKLTKLILNRNKLTNLPKEFYQLTELRCLSLNNNLLDGVDESISDFVMLEQLDLSNNNVSILPAGMGFMIRLTELNFSFNKLTELPPDIVNLRDLIKLDVSHNNLKSLPPMGELRKLQFLYAQHNDIEEIPDFQGCSNIQELYFSNNFIKELPENFCEIMCHLNILELRDNQIESIPDEIIQIAHLIKLDLTNNELTTLPNGLGMLPHLTSLKVEGNKLKNLRSDIIKAGTTTLLRHLRQKLEESDEKIVIKVVGAVNVENISFPDRYCMRNSNMLNLTMKNLTEIPDNCFNEALEAKVSVVDICKNKLQNVPEGITILKNYLTELNLSVNLLTELPDCLSECKKLKFLDISNNQLTNLPESFRDLVYLRELIVSNNRLTKIPNCIFGMIGLEILNLNDNVIEEIDVNGLKELKRLAILNLANNNINFIPPELGNLTQLRSLELRGNPFRQPRYAILEQGTESVLSYLRDRIPK